MTDQELIQALREHAEWAAGNEWETPLMLGDDLTAAADRIANQNTHIAALQKAIEDLRAQLLRWIPVTERLPKPKDEYGWIDCIVTVMESRWPRSSYDAIDAPESHELVLPAKFDCFQKIWHVAECAVNALMDIEDAPLNGWAVTHWMPLPDAPEEGEKA